MTLSLMTDDPLAWCAARWKKARRVADACADIMHLATVNPDGGAAVRVVLLKQLTPHGFGFVTNALGNKVAHWAAHPIVEACLYWPTAAIQVRVRGTVKPMPLRDIDALWKPRDRAAKIVYHMGIEQSAPIPGPDFLAKHFTRTEKEWATVADLPRARNYMGYVIHPTQIELFQHSAIRLNQRIRYTKSSGKWKTQWLAP